jgi:hypothetical protein
MAYLRRASHMAVRARRAIYCDFSIRFGMRKTDGVDNKTGSSDLPVGLLVERVSSLISDLPKNISVPTHPKSDLELFASHPTRGAYRDRHGRGEGCGGRGSVRRATWLQGGLAKGP